MKILCVDIGTGTQDVLLYDSRLDPENSFRLVVPSPTMIVRRKVQEATRLGSPIYLTGVTMGGGPSNWAVSDHITAGYTVFATPAAARSFNDDLDEIRGMGIEVVSEDEGDLLGPDVLRLELKDFDFQAIRSAFAPFGVSLDGLALVAAAVFDHGVAPPGYSDRKFRFEYIERRIQALNSLSAFAFMENDIPDEMTRMKAVVASAKNLEAPLMLMDTAPAAILGARLDTKAGSRDRLLVANIGNFHTLAFRLGQGGVEGVFEHHTGFVDVEKLDALLLSLADGSLRDEDVFNDQGHGARIMHHVPLDLPHDDFGPVVVGPRRKMMEGSGLRPYFAAPYGDMMLAGCYGMLSAAAVVVPELAGELRAALSRESGSAPWDA